MTVRLHRETAPSGCGTRLVWSDDDERWTGFDDDLFDAEVKVDRSGVSRFDVHGVAATIGCTRKSVWRHVQTGRIYGPDHYEDIPNGTFEAVWTRDQVIRMVAEWPAKKGRNHGTEARYRQHKRDGEEACQPCIEAQMRQNKQRRDAKKAKKELVNA